MKKYILSIISLGLVLSCVNTELPDPQTAKTITASTEQFSSDTKTSLDGTSVVWNSGDKLMLFQGSYTGECYQVTEASAGKVNGTFTAVESEGNGQTGVAEIPVNIAVYPYQSALSVVQNLDASSNVYSYTIYNLEFPAFQTYSENSFSDDSFVMVALTDADNTDYGFRNVLGALKIQLTGTAKISQISVEGMVDEPLAGLAKVIIPLQSVVPSVHFEENAATVITLDCGEEGVQLDATVPTPFYITLPPTEFYGGFKVLVTDTEGNTNEFATDKANTVKRSTVLAMPVKEFVAESTKEETANCYIITEPGEYRIKTVKGNSAESVGEVATAEVLWETFGTRTAPNAGDLVSSVTYSDGYIVVNTPSKIKEGNAVVAAKDAEGTILWSWHLWFVTEAIKEHTLANGAGVMMDRNLGAFTTKLESINNYRMLGLLYQWGRKDPFLSSSVSKSGLAYFESKSTIEWPAPVASDATTGTIDYVVANPTLFITDNTKNYDWYWTGKSSVDDTRWGVQKTIYDPCPPGWKVPAGGNDGIWAKADFESNFTADTKEYMVTFINNGETIYYPIEVTRGWADGKISLEVSSYYWTASMDKHWEQPYVFKVGSSIVYNQSRRAAAGCPVRCCKE